MAGLLIELEAHYHVMKTLLLLRGCADRREILFFIFIKTKQKKFLLSYLATWPFPFSFFFTPLAPALPFTLYLLATSFCTFIFMEYLYIIKCN